MSDEHTVSYTHNTINDPNGHDNYLTGVLIIAGVVSLPLAFIGGAYFIISWLVW